jgi:hypothetical protein
LSNVEFGPDLVFGNRQREPEAFEYGAHAVIVYHRRSHHTIEVLVSRHLDESANELASDSVPLILVRNEHSDLSLVLPRQLRQACHCQNLSLGGTGIPPLGDENHLAIVVDKADASERVVRRASFTT